jgi:hypothetical protein
MPHYMQQNIQSHSLSAVHSAWNDIVLYYWQKRFHIAATQAKLSAIERYKTAAVDISSRGERRIVLCYRCSGQFTQITNCWLCFRYACESCFKQNFPGKYPTSCIDHSIKCDCGELFIPIQHEKECFSCQHRTGIYSVRWEHKLFAQEGLPYGSATLRREFEAYVNAMRAKMSGDMLCSRAAQRGVVNFNLDNVDPEAYADLVRYLEK